MSIDVTPVEITDTITEREIEHYVCCSLDSTSAGVTRAFCGEMVLWGGRDTHRGDVCILCERIAQNDGCPLGEWCEVER